MRLLNVLCLVAGAKAATVAVNLTCDGSALQYHQSPSAGITLKEGDTLEIDFPDDSCSTTGSGAPHPTAIQTSAGGVVNGVTNGGGTSGAILWTPPSGSAGSYKYQCTVHAGMNAAITVTAPTKSDYVTGVSLNPLSQSTINIMWSPPGSLFDCSFANYIVTCVEGCTGTPAGCSGLTAMGVTSCNATGLTNTSAAYTFSVTVGCSIASANSDPSTSSAGYIGAATVGTPVLKTTADSAYISWTEADLTNTACSFNYYQVSFVTPFANGTVTGCENLFSCWSDISCIATGLMPDWNYTFSVQAICTNSAFNSPVMTSAKATTGSEIKYIVDCNANRTTYYLNGVANGPVSIPKRGDSLFLIFNDTTCASTMSLELQEQNGTVHDTGVTNNDCWTGTVRFDTDATTPSNLKYQCTTNVGCAGAHGNITFTPTIVRAGTPSNVMATQIEGLTDLVVTWTPGAQNDCVFSSWSVTLVGGGAVAGCTGLNAMSTMNCTATNLTASTDYSFAIKEICTNSAANSAVANTASVTTISLNGIVVCQGGGTCNCGNATICTCQATSVCNCDYADKCICQLGVCNGGHANLFVCQTTPGNCNKQCAKSCPVCLTSIITDGLGLGKNSCSGSMILQASGLLLAALLAFAS